MKDLNPAPGNLPPKARRTLAAVYMDQRERGTSPARASEIAWGVVKKRYKKKGKRWVRKKNPARKASRRPGGVTTMTIPTKKIARSPVGKVDGAAAAELGQVLELEIDGYQITWPKGSATLVWLPDKRALLVLQGGRREKPGELEHDGKTQRAFEAWAGREAKREATIDIRPSGGWRSFGGRVRRIDYWSDKYGRRREYTHKTGAGVRLYRYGAATKPPWLWVVKGGRLNVTARGIVG